MATYDVQQRVELIEFFYSIPVKDQLFKLRENTGNILMSEYLLAIT